MGVKSTTTSLFILVSVTLSSVMPGCFLGGQAMAAEATPPLPSNDPGQWIAGDDYPASALRDGLAGRVEFSLKVAADGIPSQCKVTVSSGSPILDDAACSLIMKRARFESARDAQGRPVEGIYTNSVLWVKPDPASDLHPFSMELSFVLAADGTTSNCVLSEAKGVPADKMALLTDPCMKRTYPPLLDDKGNPVARRVTVKSSLTIEPVAPVK